MSKNLIQLAKGSKSYGTKVILEDATFSVNEGEHIGVIGPNGAGKTTLFKILAGEEELDSGQVVKSSDLNMVYLQQDSQWETSGSLRELLADGIQPLWQSEMLAEGMGIPPEMLDSPLQELSGGFRMRSQLVSLLSREPNLLLLDEPTNYLDLETLLVLERTLQSFKGAILLISHDREFLKRTTHYTLEIEMSDVTKFNGHIEDYFEQKALLREQLIATQSQQLKKRQHIEAFVNRFRAKASKARQAQSKLKQLNKMELISIKSLPVSAKINIPASDRSPKKLIELKNVELGYADGPSVLKDIDLEIERNEHLAVVGYNGAGKSTLIKALGNILKPRKGEVHHTDGITVSYFSQHVHEQLDDSMTVFEELQAKAHPSINRQQILDTAGSLLFNGEDVHKKISWLSGGERMRVALGQILLSKSTIMLLDEPTNHLDFHTVEAMTESLKTYAGALVIVSHDRSFVAQVGKKIIEVRDGGIQVYPGSYDEYIWSLQKGELAKINDDSKNNDSGKISDKTKDSPPSVRVRTGSASKQQRKRERERKKESDRLEKALDEVRKKQELVNKAVTTEQDPSKQLQLVQELEVLQNESSQLEANWLEIQYEDE